MPAVTMRELLESGVHFGHQTRRWNPKMKPYVFGARNGIYIIDLQKTVDQTRAACTFASSITAEGKKILFVGTKKQAKEVIEEEAKRSGMYHVTNRWLGGMLTNYQTVKASIDRLKKIEALKDSDEWNEVPKKEQSRYMRDLEKLHKSLGGIQDMKKLPGAIFVIDTEKEHIAIKEAKKLGIPVVAVVDTNYDPSLVDYAIPGNDDAIRAVQLYARAAADAVLEGKASAPQYAAAAKDEFVELDAEGNPRTKEANDRRDRNERNDRNDGDRRKPGGRKPSGPAKKTLPGQRRTGPVAAAKPVEAAAEPAADAAPAEAAAEPTAE